MTEQSATARPAGAWHYVKEAFLFRWNLLLFLGSAAASAMSPYPDVLLPALGALELLYVGGLTAIPRFRAAVDARVHARRAPPGRSAGPPEQPLVELLRGLEPPARQRFDRLRSRCLDMQRIAQGVRGHTAADGRADEIRTPALDRLLWAFLRLLYSQQALRRFLAATDEAAIRRGLEEVKARQAQARERGDERIVRSLADSIATAELRLDNHGKAVSNAEFVQVELDRIEGKIQALTEMAVSHQDADAISSQVDAVAESMTQTEDAIRELHQITGLSEQLSATPPILEADLERVAR
jgi:DNA-binding FrmR family transcriptional regulator